jgi:hypothetical protein
VSAGVLLNAISRTENGLSSQSYVLLASSRYDSQTSFPVRDTHIPAQDVILVVGQTYVHRLL